MFIEKAGIKKKKINFDHYIYIKKKKHEIMDSEVCKVCFLNYQDNAQLIYDKRIMMCICTCVNDDKIIPK